MKIYTHRYITLWLCLWAWNKFIFSVPVVKCLFHLLANIYYLILFPIKVYLLKQNITFIDYREPRSRPMVRNLATLDFCEIAVDVNDFSVQCRKDNLILIFFLFFEKKNNMIKYKRNTIQKKIRNKHGLI